jgi:hypothetical protein
MAKKSDMPKKFGGELAGKPVDRAALQPLKELGSAMEETTGPGSMADLGRGPIADVSAAGGCGHGSHGPGALAGRRTGEPALLSALPEVLSFHLCQGRGGWRSPPG